MKFFFSSFFFCSCLLLFFLLLFFLDLTFISFSFFGSCCSFVVVIDHLSRSTLSLHPLTSPSHFTLSLHPSTKVSTHSIILQPIKPDIDKEQVVHLKEPLYVPPGHYLGIYSRGYHPRIQYKENWSTKEPVRYDVYCALKDGGHPTGVGDVVYRMLHSAECAGMSFVVKKFQSKEEIKKFLINFEKEKEQKKEEQQEEKVGDEENQEGDEENQVDTSTIPGAMNAPQHPVCESTSGEDTYVTSDDTSLQHWSGNNYDDEERVNTDDELGFY